MKKSLFIAAFAAITLAVLFSSVEWRNNELTLVPLRPGKIPVTFHELPAKVALGLPTEPSVFHRYDLEALEEYYAPKDPAFYKLKDLGQLIRAWDSLVGIEPYEVQFENRGRIDTENQLTSYFGLLHSHSSLSDGRGEPEEAFKLARDIAGLDFFALTDHSEYWRFQNKKAWEKLGSVAKSFTNETFVALRGFEYSNSLLGHYTVLGTSDYTDSFAKLDVEAFYDWLSLRPNSIAVFAHPGYHEYRKTFDHKHFQFNSKTRPNIVGVDVLHRNGFNYYLKGYSKELPYIDEAIQQGWRVGAFASQDNHKNNWAVQDSVRLGLLMPSLSEENIMESLRKRRFYATQNENLQLSLTLKKLRGVAQMGDEVLKSEVGPTAEVELKFADADGNHDFNGIEVIVNGQVKADMLLKPKSKKKKIWEKKWNIKETAPPSKRVLKAPVAGVFKFALPLNEVSGGLTYFYVRLYQKNYSVFTQTSPIFIRY